MPLPPAQLTSAYFPVPLSEFRQVDDEHRPVVLDFVALALVVGGGGGGGGGAHELVEVARRQIKPAIVEEASGPKAGEDEGRVDGDLRKRLLMSSPIA